MSAQANLIGFYPPVGPGDRTAVCAQLVPIHTVPKPLDNVRAPRTVMFVFRNDNVP